MSELIGSVTDRVRRTGTAVALTGRSNAEREPPRGGLAFDPETWVLLAEEKVLPRVPEIVSGRQMAWGIQAILANRGEVDPKG